MKVRNKKKENEPANGENKPKAADAKTKGKPTEGEDDEEDDDETLRGKLFVI